jgi:hypothetical protein
MNRYAFLFCAIFALCVIAGCSQDRTTAPDPTTATNHTSAVTVDPEAVAAEIVALAGWETDSDVSKDVGPAKTGGCVNWIEREVIVDDIVHYRTEIRFGPGPYDKFGLHRVVKERRPHKPIRTQKTLFALHGSPGHFEVMFLAGSVIPSAPDDQAIAVYLAQNGVDVWGIDQAYTLLPQDISDFSFMSGWGMQFEVDNLRTGMAIARLVRLFTGNGFGKLNLMGYSTGLMTGFAALNLETQLPANQRHIGGFIPVDYFYKTLDPIGMQGQCANAAATKALLDAGVYNDQNGLLFQTMGFLAQNDPDGDSPIAPGLTNKQFALSAAALTGYLFGFHPIESHFFAGVFDEGGNPVDLRYTEYTHFLEWLQQFNNYGPNLFGYDIAVLHCDEEDSPHDDFLHDIDVPVFFLGANGGWGDRMDYTASLLGSDDITILNVQLQSEKLLDIGHVDIYTAGNAQDEFWVPVLDWINDHTTHGRKWEDYAGR